MPIEDYTPNPGFFMDFMITLFGYYYSECWYRDENSAEYGKYYYLFGNHVCYGSYSQVW